MSSRRWSIISITVTLAGGLRMLFKCTPAAGAAGMPWNSPHVEFQSYTNITFSNKIFDK